MKLNIILALVFVNTICTSAFAAQCQDSAQAIAARELNLEGNTIAQKLDAQNQVIDSESNTATILSQRSTRYQEIVNELGADEEILSKVFTLNTDDGQVLISRNNNSCDLSLKIFVDGGEALIFDANIVDLSKDAVTYKMVQDGVEQTVRLSRLAK